MFVLHATWSNNALYLWAESVDGARELFTDGLGRPDLTVIAEPSTDDDDQLTQHVEDPEPVATAVTVKKSETHTYAVTPDDLQQALQQANVLDADDIESTESLSLFLPHRRVDEELLPEPSERLGSELSWGLDKDGLELQSVLIPMIKIKSKFAAKVLIRLEDRLQNADACLGHDMRFWIEAGRLILDLMKAQRFVPTMIQERDGALRAAWLPWLNDRETSARTAHLLSSIPAVACAVEGNDHDAWSILENALRTMCDAAVRDILISDDYPDAIDGRDLIGDQHAGWLAGLLNGSNVIPVQHGSEMQMLRSARSWIAHLDDGGARRAVRLCLQLSEPISSLDGNAQPDDPWVLSFHLVTADDPPIVIDAERIWAPDSAGDSILSQVGSERETAADVLLTELARAARIFPKLEASLGESSPVSIELALDDAYEFLREIRPILMESGVEILVPSWWGQARSRLAAHLLIDSEPLDTEEGGAWGSGAGRNGELGLHSLVDYSWQITLGDRAVTFEEFNQFAAQGKPLVQIDGTWVEIRAEDVKGAAKFINDHPGGEMTVLEAMRLAHGVDNEDAPIPILGMKATGWVAQVFGGMQTDDANEQFDILEQPKLFQGELRPYQLKGLSWLSFLDRFGLGACLADDMGLGKTIQLIALLQHERQESPDPSVIGPTLLVVPMSVLGNWAREFKRFSPELNVHIQHGVSRPMGDSFLELAKENDVIVTTYALVTRDRELLEKVDWWRITLDEAQHIKNPPTKQTAAIRAMKSRHRIALTGTPVENRLTELWSIMEFCCPGYLGSGIDFRRHFAVPIERHRDEGQARRLRQLVQPFILRRLKTDPNVITDLPPLVQMKQNVTPTPEQADLYDSIVEDMLRKVDSAEGIRRRGLVLASLVKLKQVCNHPAHYLESVNRDAGPITPERSGKTMRLIQMLEEVVATDDRALIFTQYRRMGHLLVSMLRHEFDIEPLFLHGGTPQTKRDELVDRFQSRDPSCPLFILSLKAGGVGLNLTAANHVFHFDRWWNPAVENQATDRAFRIGQDRTVTVQKMISSGTLEERVDQMIEQKTELSERIIGAGESWLTELSTGQLRDLLTLRRSSLEEINT